MEEEVEGGFDLIWSQTNSSSETSSRASLHVNCCQFQVTTGIDSAQDVRGIRGITMHCINEGRDVYAAFSHDLFLVLYCERTLSLCLRPRQAFLMIPSIPDGFIRLAAAEHA